MLIAFGAVSEGEAIVSEVIIARITSATESARQALELLAPDEERAGRVGRIHPLIVDDAGEIGARFAQAQRQEAGAMPAVDEAERSSVARQIANGARRGSPSRVPS